jgi:hypothetical protein
MRTVTNERDRIGLVRIELKRQKKKADNTNRRVAAAAYQVALTKVARGGIDEAIAFFDSKLDEKDEEYPKQLVDNILAILVNDYADEDDEDEPFFWEKS